MRVCYSNAIFSALRWWTAWVAAHVRVIYPQGSAKQTQCHNVCVFNNFCKKVGTFFRRNQLVECKHIELPDDIEHIYVNSMHFIYINSDGRYE